MEPHYRTVTVLRGYWHNGDMATMDKVQARRHFREARRSLDATRLNGDARALAGHVLRWVSATAPVPAGEARRPGTPVVAAYLSVGAEPGTHHLVRALHEAGYDVVVPVCEPDYQLSWCRWTPQTRLQPRRAGAVRLMEPVGTRLHFSALDALRLVLVPALAVDRAGDRLGQGGGYYDRFLAQLRTVGGSAHTAGYVYGHELVAPGTFDAGSLDMPLDGAFTPAGYHPALPGGGEPPCGSDHRDSGSN
jgi:5-formyltetrahydrofolate cyclo-ligase